MTDHYVFGYASLMNDDVRDALQISHSYKGEYVKGIQRKWDAFVAGSDRAKLVISKQKHASVSGVVLTVTDNCLNTLDALNRGYERVDLDYYLNPEDYPEPPSTKGLPGRMWIYLPNTSARSNLAMPIIQSYVDAVVGGSLGLGFDDSSAKKFVATTEGWGGPWVNDRANPRYKNKDGEPLIHSTFDESEVDAVLMQLLGEHFQKRTILTQ